MKNYSEMTTNQLLADKRKLGEQIEGIKTERRAITMVLDERAVSISAEARVAGMSETDKDALRQALGVKGIPSEEKVSTPGAR